MKENERGWWQRMKEDNEKGQRGWKSVMKVDERVWQRMAGQERGWNIKQED